MPLGDVLRLDTHPVAVVATDRYPSVGILNRGRGLFDKGVLEGSQTSYGRLFRLSEGQVVYSKLFGWEGAVALVPPKYDGYFVSSEFPTFTPRSDRVSPAFLEQYLKSMQFTDDMARSTNGLGQRRQRVNVDAFLRITVPLPSRPDQDRIAAHLGRLAVGVQAASRTSPSSLPSPEMAWLEMVFNHAWPLIPLGRVFEISRGSVLRQDPDGREVALGQASVRWGFLDHTLAKLLDDEWANRQPPSRRVVQGDLLLNSTGEGTLGRAAIVRERDAGMLHDSKVLRLRPSREVISEFTAMFLRSPQGRNAVSSVKGANTTKQTELGIQRTVGLSAPLPSIDVQRRVIAAWRRIDPLFGEADGLRRKREVLVGSVLPAARNEIFSAMR